MNRVLYSIVVLLLAGCTTGLKQVDTTVDDLLKRGSEALNIMNTYPVIKHDFEKGRIMRARARALAMDKSHSDYARTQKLLKEKIEPARRKIFVHYLRAAKKKEQQGLWSEAMWAYDQAKTVTIKPEVMEAKRAEMEAKMRQLRFDRLLAQRRKEDGVLLANVSAYEAPRGVSARDEVFERMREHYQDEMESRANAAFREARRYLRKDLPEIAYIEIESFLRLRPGNISGDNMLTEIRRELPGYLKIAGQLKHVEKSAASIAVKTGQKSGTVTAKDVNTALKAGEFIKARQLAHIYRRSGGVDADRLLGQVQKKLDARAARSFKRGSEAFRSERLDTAIEYWSEAVALSPDQSEYVEALRRARQLKERLTLLQQQNPNDPVPEKE